MIALKGKMMEQNDEGLIFYKVLSAAGSLRFLYYSCIPLVTPAFIFVPFLTHSTLAYNR